MRAVCRKRRVRVLALLLLGLSGLLWLGGCGSGTSEDLTWSTVSVDGVTLRFRCTGVPGTALGNPTVLAAGLCEDPRVVAAIGQVTGRSRSQVAELLSSYATGAPHFLRVLQLRSPAYVTRYWGDPQYKLGRWYMPSEPDHLYLPNQACQLFALPLSNNGYCVSLYRLQAGVKLIAGDCADMTWNTEAFGPYATGGGQQLYVPDATRWVVDHAELNGAAIELVSELRYPAASGFLN